MIGSEINGFLILRLDEETNKKLKLERKQGSRKNAPIHYICKCLSCGKEYSVAKQKLLSRKTYGCKDCNKYNFDKYVNIQINNWFILDYLKNGKFKCKCKCDKIKEVNPYNIISGLSKDCGCGRNKKVSDMMSINSLVGERYGKLIVLEEIGKNKWGKIMYKCKCDCGNEVNVLSNSLRTNHTQSCGCTKSITPSKIKIYLEKLGYKVESEKRINLTNKNISYLVFDLYVEELNLAIEYDGKPHFIPIDWGGKGIEWAIENLECGQMRDMEKDKYCYENDIFLLRIPFTRKDDFESLINEIIEIITNND